MKTSPPLIAGDAPGDLDRFLLGIEAARHLFGPRLAHRPLVAARDDMLILGGHGLDS
ncbi:MAG: hypothetical protein OXC65_02360 [Thiotrichales bacterium]|nr:hypothetical protein [Thiotrichales bacterium]